MSRGLGTIQRAALEALQESAAMLDSVTLACQDYGHTAALDLKLKAQPGGKQEAG